MLAKVCIRISRKKDFIKPFGNRIYIRKEIPPMVNNNVDWRKVLVKIAGNISLTELNLNILEEAMCCLCECDLCDDLENFDCPLWDGADDWLDLEDDWEAPEWINTL